MSLALIFYYTLVPVTVEDLVRVRAISVGVMLKRKTKYVHIFQPQKRLHFENWPTVAGAKVPTLQTEMNNPNPKP